MPLVPKGFWREFPRNRARFNEFIPWIKALQLPDCLNVIDVGANHGDFSQAACAIYPGCRVLLVEPQPALAKELKQRAATRNGKWIIEECALGATEGAATLHLSTESDEIASLAGFQDSYRAETESQIVSTTVQCKLATLDSLLKIHAFEFVDLLKIDVEGFEFEVLKGAVVAMDRVKAVIVETSLVRHTTPSPNPLAGLLKYLDEKGFAVIAVHPSGYSIGEPWRPIEFNVLARKPGI